MTDDAESDGRMLLLEEVAESDPNAAAELLDTMAGNLEAAGSTPNEVDQRAAVLMLRDVRVWLERCHREAPLVPSTDGPLSGRTIARALRQAAKALRQL